jgi:hypothetical protein
MPPSLMSSTRRSENDLRISSALGLPRTIAAIRSTSCCRSLLLVFTLWPRYSTDVDGTIS